jgi:type II secretory pathway component PulC
LIAAPALPEAPTLVRPPVVALEQDPDRYAVIGERNLFRTLQVAPGPVVEEEKLEETTLRLRLLGTIVSTIPERSIASVEDMTKRETFALAIGDEVAGAKLLRVERYRVVLDNQGKLEQITVDDAPTPAVASRRAPRARARPAERNSVRARARSKPTPAAKVDVTQTQSAPAQPVESAHAEGNERELEMR